MLRRICRDGRVGDGSGMVIDPFVIGDDDHRLSSIIEGNGYSQHIVLGRVHHTKICVTSKGITGQRHVTGQSDWLEIFYAKLRVKSYIKK